MAKQQQSRKSKSAGSHRAKHGARSNLAVDPLLGILTYAPHYSMVPSLDNHADYELRIRRANLGLPRQATVSDTGFYGRPKSSHKSHLLNPIHTGGMAFPDDIATVPCTQDGRIRWVAPVHDEHRKAASAERKEARKDRSNRKNRVARRVINRAVRLVCQDTDTDEQQARQWVELTLRKLDTGAELTEDECMYAERIVQATEQIDKLLARLPS